MSDSSAKQTPAGVRRHVVCIDDEVAVLKTFELILDHLGYKVTMFSSASQALDWLQTNWSSTDLVLTDQTMPGVSGVDLAARLNEFAPTLPVVLISGYADVIEGGSRPNIRGTLCKPVGYDALVQTVRSVIPQGGGFAA